MPPTTTREDRAAGAILGTLIGDALGVGPHWYYDLDELRRDYGEWIDTYAPPRPGRYHEGLQPGDLSQTGQVVAMLLESVAERGGYEEADFTARLDALLDTLDGTPWGGRYTDQAMRDVWRTRQEGRPWGERGSFADTAEAALRTPILAALHSGDLRALGEVAQANIKLTHVDPFIVGQSTAFGLIVGALIEGRPFMFLSRDLRNLAKQGKIPFVPALLAEERAKGAEFAPPTKDVPYVDALLQPGWAWRVAHDPDIRIEPPWKACVVYGLACTLGFMLPAAYYLVSRFPGNFEMAVLSALNGGGNNMARAALTGAVSGAMVGLSGIPQRFIDGLTDGARYVALAQQVAGLEVTART